MRPLSLLFLSLLVIVSACDDQPLDPAQTTPVAEADIERFRAEIFQETLTLDADLARLEQEAAGADSAARVAYDPVLNRLRADRQRLQVRLDSLRPVPQALFDTTQVQVRAQTAQLAASLRRARYDAAADYATLQTATARGVAELDGRLARFRPYAVADTTGALQRDLDSLAADRDRLLARLRAYPDTSQAQYAPFREAITTGVLGLERRVDGLAADTTSEAEDRPEA